jgi:CheY-like chemotaxis protein/glycine cleavage system H lipoate-binding protein
MKEAEANPAPSPARILVVDDEEIIHSSLQKILGRCGHQVTATLDAEQALARLERERFDLVITDLMMPRMNGIELLERIRARAPDLPVLLVTGYPTIRTAMEALRRGAVDYLAKPFTRQELLAPIARALRRSAGCAAGEPPPAVGTPPAAGEPPASGTGAGAGEPPPARTAAGPSVEPTPVALRPGDRLILPEHAWARFRQDGVMEFGVERGFLDAVGRLRAVEAPRDGDLVEQGYVGLRLTSEAGEVHGLIAPLSGQVIEVNQAALAAPAAVDPATWLIRVLPTNLDGELAVLERTG